MVNSKLTDYHIEAILLHMVGLRVETPEPERKVEVQLMIDKLRAWRDERNNSNKLKESNP